MSSEEKITEIIETLSELNEDPSVPKNVKSKIEGIMSSLKEEGEIPLKISKALNMLDEIADDNNLQSYTRTQIWNVVSVLEKLAAH